LHQVTRCGIKFCCIEAPDDAPAATAKRIDEGNAAHRSVPRAKVFSMAGKPLITSFEAGMRELTLMTRLGHATPDSMKIYTRVSDPEVVKDYRHATGGGAP
jgi:hypothetical protein